MLQILLLDAQDGQRYTGTPIMKKLFWRFRWDEVRIDQSSGHVHLFWRLWFYWPEWTLDDVPLVDGEEDF